MTQLISDILDRAADLIEPEGKWTQEAYARVRSGWPIEPEERSAVCWCLLGAVRKVCKFDSDVSAIGPFLRQAINCYNITGWNDAPERTQSEVVSKLREAAAKAREAGR